MNIRIQERTIKRATNLKRVNKRKTDLKVSTRVFIFLRLGKLLKLSTISLGIMNVNYIFFK